MTDRHKKAADLINAGKPVDVAMLYAGYGAEFVKGSASTFVADVLAPLGLVKARHHEPPPKVAESVAKPAPAAAKPVTPKAAK